MKLHHLWFALIGLFSLPAWAADDALVVTLAGVQHAKGQMRVSLYSDPMTFRKEDKAQAIQAVVPVVGETVVRFDKLMPGRYAIMAYHDEDGNGALNRRFGMFPTEGFGLSNNPDVMGPPKFEDSAFDVPARDGQVRIKIAY
ncbi:MAG: DUF2141 domain-containing protein [Sideroxyarcus sp.]|nr:DUF2141 domain-containing protein [Sideroxyarcus sp.]